MAAAKAIQFEVAVERTWREPSEGPLEIQKKGSSCSIWRSSSSSFLSFLSKHGPEETREIFVLSVCRQLIVASCLGCNFETLAVGSMKDEDRNGEIRSSLDENTNKSGWGKRKDSPQRPAMMASVVRKKTWAANGLPTYKLLLLQLFTFEK